jgi:proline iminopeptidase
MKTFERDFETREGYVTVPGGRVWYQIVGSGGGYPLLTLHGGPGLPHDYILSLRDLADERPVIFYDQLGCGKSDLPDDPSLWRMERFVEELAEVRRALGLTKVHLLGQSFGTMVAVDYLLTKPTGVLGLILASPCVSIPRFIEDAYRLRKLLPQDVQKILNQGEATGDFESPDYKAATDLYYKHFLVRMDPLPEGIKHALDNFSLPVYGTMWGPSEPMVTGNLRDYDRAARLAEIKIPTLLTCGRHDETTPETVGYFHSLMPGSEFAVFEKSAHMAHWEEADRYLPLIRSFLSRTEKRLAS